MTRPTRSLLATALSVALVAGTAAFRGGPDHYAANIAALRAG